MAIFLPNDPLEIGTILGGAGIAMTVVHIPAGYFADKFGRRRMMWAAWFLGVISGLIMAAADTLPMFIFGVLLYGVTAFVVAPMNSYITAARGSWSVGRAIAFTSATYNSGAIIGPLVGGLIGDRYGYANMYFFATIIFTISTFFILFIKPQPVEDLEQNSKSANQLVNRIFLSFLPIVFFAHFAMYVSQPLATNYLQNSHKLSLSDIGFLGSIGSIGSVVLSLGFGYLDAGFGFILSQVATIFFPLLLVKGSTMPFFAFGYFMLGGFRAARAMSIALLRNYINSANMGLAYGIAETTSSLAMIAAPVLAGYLYEVDPDWMLHSGIIFTFLSVIISFGYIKFLNRS
jgi:MFS family permease